MHADPVLRRAEASVPRDGLARRWRDLADAPENPDRYELNEFGELILSPRPSTGHQAIAFEVGRRFR